MIFIVRLIGWREAWRGSQQIPPEPHSLCALVDAADKESAISQAEDYVRSKGHTWVRFADKTAEEIIFPVSLQSIVRASI